LKKKPKSSSRFTHPEGKITTLLRSTYKTRPGILKPNFEGYTYTDIKTRLKEIVDSTLTFDDVDQCIDYITDLDIDTKIYFIISGRYCQYIVPIVYQWSMITHIYFLHEFSKLEITEHLSLAKQFQKRCCASYFNINDLLNTLKYDIESEWKEMISHNISARYKKLKSYQNATIFETEDELGLFYQCLMDCLPFVSINDTAKTDMIFEIQKDYKDDPIELNKISEFEKTFSEEHAISWYTRDCFIYRMLNKAFRTQNIDVIFKYRFFMVDLYKQLKQLHDVFQNNNPNTIMTVYRGQRLQPNELQQFQKNIDGYTITNTFLSTTTDRDVARIFAGDGSESPFIESILLEIKVDTAVKTTKPYSPQSKNIVIMKQNLKFYFLLVQDLKLFLLHKNQMIEYGR